MISWDLVLFNFKLLAEAQAASSRTQKHKRPTGTARFRHFFLYLLAEERVKSRENTRWHYAFLIQQLSTEESKALQRNENYTKTEITAIRDVD